MMVLSLLLSFLSFAFSVDVGKDLKVLNELNRKLSSLEKFFKTNGISLKKVDELNGLGYPIYVLYERYSYLRDKGGKFEKVYQEAKALQEKYFRIKREIFPHFVMEDAKRNNLKICSVEVKGKDATKLIVRIEHPEREEERRKVYENTQLYYAERLGFESIDFKKCRNKLKK